MEQVKKRKYKERRESEIEHARERDEFRKVREYGREVREYERESERMCE